MVLEDLIPEELELDEECWRAVLARDGRRDGEFVFAVRSTGVYCRPSCPARRPKQENVRLFASARSAAQAGFRACKRCLPDAEEPPEAELVRRACEAIGDGAPTLAELGRRLHVDPGHLRRIFLRLTGVTPGRYAEARRAGRLKEALSAGEPVLDAAYGAGYGSASRLYERSTHPLGMTPSSYRRGGPGMRVRYAVAGCQLGRLLVGTTERGVCAVYLGDSDAELARALREELPRAEIARDDAGLRESVEAVLGRLEGREPAAALPLDVRATAFQWRVWEELTAIPRGETRTYGEIARGIGQPTAARAVARACATNPVSVVIPCHRAVRADGGEGGYRWGLERKRELLEQERSRAEGRPAEGSTAGS